MKNSKVSSKKFRRGRRTRPKKSTTANRAITLSWRGPTFMPPRFRTNLCFSKSVSINNAGGISANVRFCPTYVYDIDPTLGSTACPGFAELSVLYRYYRLNGSSITVDFLNYEAFPATVGVIPLNFDPTANHSATTTVSYMSDVLMHTGPVGAITGSSVKTIKHAVSTAFYAGAVNKHVIDNYVGSSSGTSPANNWFWDVIFYPANTLVSGCIAHIKIIVDLDFIELNAPGI
jgi:hypothetical protein